MGTKSRIVKISGGGGGEITYMGKQLRKTLSGGSVCS